MFFSSSSEYSPRTSFIRFWYWLQGMSWKVSTDGRLRSVGSMKICFAIRSYPFYSCMSASRMISQTVGCGKIVRLMPETGSLFWIIRESA